MSVEVLTHAANVLWQMHEHGGTKCGWQAGPDSPPCGEEAEYLIADGTRVSAGGDIEAAPLWRCKTHLELELEEPVQEQPISRRVEGPGDFPAPTSRRLQSETPGPELYEARPRDACWRRSWTGRTPR